MSKRFVPLILRQASLVLRVSEKEFYFRRGEDMLFEFPMLDVEPESSYQQTVKRYCSDLGAEIALKGIIRMDVGRSMQHDYYRCVYYAEINSTSP
jgi:hypothetical protein